MSGGGPSSSRDRDGVAAFHTTDWAARQMMPADPAEHRPRSEEHPLSSPAPGQPMISTAVAATALYELFLANADRGDNAANDDLIAEMVGRIRSQQDKTPDRSQLLDRIAYDTAQAHH
ncbi:MAG: hypothetical protein ACRDRX_26755 [Pseudonocardiaceae bacterium]